ncbi:hypothetical protein [Phormidesmis priestleyi]
MNFEVNSLISVLTFAAGAGSAVWGMISWYAGAEKKKYAAEREFQHLKRNQEQMKQSIEHVTKEIDALSDDVKTLTAVFNVMLTQNGQSISGILAYKKHRGKPDRSPVAHSKIPLRSRHECNSPH